MKILVRAVISGFGFSLGSALFKQVSKKLGWDDSDTDKSAAPRDAAATDGDADGVPDSRADSIH